jgi:hypothetical protein
MYVKGNHSGIQAELEAGGIKASEKVYQKVHLKKIQKLARVMVG